MIDVMQIETAATSQKQLSTLQIIKYFKKILRSRDQQ